VGAYTSKSGLPSAEIPSLVPPGGRFEGRIIARGPARLDGHIVGSVHVDGHLVAGDGAHIEGDLEVGEVTLAGRVDGEVVAQHRAHLAPGATVRGTLRTPELRMDEGATLEGRCQAGEPE
jgi:cytoskeletal protein CcmA (bactofilin family)